MVPRLGRSVADRLDRAGQVGQGITDRNQAFSVALHRLYFPMRARQDPRRPKDRTMRPSPPRSDLDLNFLAAQ